MKVARDILAGVVLAAIVWALLESSQAQWSEATTRAPVSELVVPTLALVLIGSLLAGLVVFPVSPWTTASAAVLVALLVGPLVAGAASWWPERWPGSPLRLGSFTGTYLAIGVLVAVTIGRIISRRGEAASRRSPEGSSAEGSTSR